MTSAVSSQVASSRSAQHHFEAGHRIAYMAVRLENIMALYHRHATQFGFVSDEINRFVVDSLREKASLQTALNELDHAVRLNPNNVAWQDEFALVLEQLGRDNEALRVRTTIAHLDPSLNANNIALGRLFERKKTAEDMKEYYARLFKEGTGGSLLAVCRGFAFSERVDDAALMDLKKRVRFALTNPHGQVPLHLAMGFIAIAERNYNTARTSFLSASILVERPEGQPATTRTNAFNFKQAMDTDYDPWSLAFANAFLLEVLPQNQSRGAILTPIDPIRLPVVRGALLRSRNAPFPALEQYGTALSRLLGQPRPRFYRLYKGYRIVMHEQRFFAVPPSVANFSIYQGTVVRIPGVLGKMRPFLEKQLNARRRTVLGQMWRLSRRHVFPILARVPGMRRLKNKLSSLPHTLYSLAQKVYVKLMPVPGALIGSDVTALREQIDELNPI